jgi:hydroxymethylglutaryl-CoA lyase
VLPSEVLVVDVSPRDGLQNEARAVSTPEKVALVEALAGAGVRRIEATSFVSPRAVPQMADAAEVMAQIKRAPGVEYAVLVPNERGLERALEAKADVVNIVVVATETFNARNVNMTVAESMDQASAVASRARTAGVNPTAVLGASFHCPFEGPVPEERVLGLVGKFVDAGFSEVTLADTIGAADPAHVARLGEAVTARYPGVALGIHLHDTRGLGLANAYAAVTNGYVRLETSLAGIGGCPFAPGATGNACTEDLVFMLESMGIATGISLAALIEAAKTVPPIVGHGTPSRMVAAGPRSVVPVPK